MKKNFKFSVIIPIYNVEEYLEETILSVINQTIGFEENIQMILINDGSPDSCEEICLKYKKMYPDNIVYYKQKNSGVSAARNKGIDLASGDLTTFLDGDDKWSHDAFLESYRCFLENETIHLYSCRMNYFDAKTGSHPLNYKFKENKVVNILEEWEYPQLSSSSVIIKTSILKKYKYDKKIKFSEDNKFINEILFDEQKIMMLNKPVYYYRKRKTLNSAIQTCTIYKDWYFVTPEKVYSYLFHLSKIKFGFVIPYIQNVVMYDLQWRIKEEVPNHVLDSEEKDRYIKIISYLLKEIDDEIICKQRNLYSEYKLYTFQLKYGKNILKETSLEDGYIKYNGNKIFNLTHFSPIKINVININDRFDVMGQLSCVVDSERFNLYYQFNGILKELKLDKKFKGFACSLVDELLYNKVFSFTEEIIEKENELKFYLGYDGKLMELQASFTIHGRLQQGYATYYEKEGKMLYLKKNAILIRKKNILFKIKFDIIFLLWLLKNKKISQFCYRSLAKLVGLFKRKKIWLLSDRTSVANDNGMHMFKYICKQNNKKIAPYFVIDKNSKDYEKMKRIGPVLAYNSLRYKIYFLLADKIISSQADGWVTNAFGKNENYYRDLYRFDFVFLQHGITKNDVSEWLNKINKNIKLFVTTAEKERYSIIDGNYYYDEQVVKLTGMPRYDNLVDKKEKIISIMPTWRKAFGGKVNGTLGTREYNPDFKETAYFKYFNKLINDKKLLKVMKDKGYKGIFVIHPSHMENYKDFCGNVIFKVVDGYADYQEIFKKSSLLISDYSSVTFDFAYLYKPIIYTQFDKEIFFKTHLYDEGYFKDEVQGFGPVLKTYEATVKEIIKYIKNDCKLEDEYKRRIDAFYKFHDTKNCERVYNEINKI